MRTSLPWKSATFAIFVLAIGFGLAAQPQTLKDDRAKAIGFAEQNSYVQALPLFEKIAVSYPNDVLVWTHYGIALAVNSAVSQDSQTRKKMRQRAYAALKKAADLGTENVNALNMLDQLTPDGGEDDNFSIANPEVEKALREGELHFGNGDFVKAFASYERAYKLDPSNYEAALFAGDTFYSRKMYSESEPWFAKAVAIDPDREMAFRFWGDALLAQGKTREAQEQFIDAFIAEPYNRHAWENINKLTRKYQKQFDVKGVFPPGTDGFDGIVLDKSAFKKEDGTELWQKYEEVRNSWRKERFTREFPGQQYRRSLKEEVAALREVVKATESTIKAGGLKVPHHSLTNLVELSNKGMLEPYLLLLTPNEDFAEDYFEYRKSNRPRLRKFLVEHVFVF